MKGPLWYSGRTLSLDRLLTRLVIKTGPRNPVSRLLIWRGCQKCGVAVAFKPDRIELSTGSRAIWLAPKQLIYAPGVAFQFNSLHSAVKAQRIGDRFVVDYSRPAVHLYGPQKIPFEFSSFPEEPDAIESYTAKFMPSPGDLVFDIGANCGVSVHHFSKLVGPTGRVIAFEPDSINYAVLLRNIERHALKNVTALKMAVSDANGKAELSNEGTTGSGLLSHLPRASAGTVDLVETITLTDAFAKWGEPSLCKIDIEGAEVAVIQSSVNLFRACRAHFVLDTSHLVDGSMTAARVEEAFRRGGYEAQSELVAGMPTTWAAPSSKLAAV